MRESKVEPSRVGERLKGTGGPQSPERAIARESPQHRQPEPWVQACSECWFGSISASCIPSVPGRHTFWVAGMVMLQTSGEPWELSASPHPLCWRAVYSLWELWACSGQQYTG